MKVKTSPTKNTPKSKGKKTSAAAALKDEADKLSTKSESDSEPDRRRSTRGATRASSNIDKTPELTERKRRSNNSTPVDSKLTNESETKESASTTNKDSSNKKNDSESVKLSETEDVDVINSPQSSTTSDETYNNADNEKADASPRSTFGKYKIGSKISVRLGTGKNQRAYSAKILEVDRDDSGGVVYYIHYNGWNHR